MMFTKKNANIKNYFWVGLILILLMPLFNNCGEGFSPEGQSSAPSTGSGDVPAVVDNPPLPQPPGSVCPPAPTGRTLYVSSTIGNDATTYDANSATNPWRTIGRAVRGSFNGAAPNASQAAQSGDLVLISAGVYWEDGQAGGDRFTVSLNPINSGTETRPIVFRGLGRVEVRLNAGFRGAMIGCNARNYIIWDHFYINDYYGGSISDTGPVVFSGSASYCQLINSEVIGHPGTYFHGYPAYVANYRGVSLEPTNHIIVRNNKIHDFRGGQNEAAIMSYDSSDNIIENNLIYNNGAGVFIKGAHVVGSQARNIIRKNIFYGNTFSGIRALGAVDTVIYQNILYNNSGLALHAGFGESERSRFFNNTVFNNGGGIHIQGADLIDVWFNNNIIANSIEQAIFNWDIASPAAQNVSFNRNLYFNNLRHAFYEGGVRTITYADWQSVYRKDMTSLVADPLFVNAATNDFHLQVNSPANQLGQDQLDLNNNGSRTDLIPAGAYITGNEIIGNYSDVCP